MAKDKTIPPTDTVVEAKPNASPGAPAANPRDAKIEDLEVKIARLESLMSANAVNSAGAIQDEKSKAEQKLLQAEVEKGNQRRSQEAADRQFPEGKHRWNCSLSDGNGHPALVISAENEVDAAARYMAVCGVRSSEKQVQVQRA